MEEEISEVEVTPPPPIDVAEYRMLKNLHAENVGQFLCVVCDSFPRPSQFGSEFLTCNQDHVVCVSCRFKILKLECPMCRLPISGKITSFHVKNLMDRYLKSAKYECKYKMCKETDLKPESVIEHDIECEFKPSECPTCKRDFLMGDGPPQCCPLSRAVYDAGKDAWKFVVPLRDIYDAPRNDYDLRGFVPVNLFVGENQTVSRFVMCALLDDKFKCLKFAVVCLEALEFSKAYGFRNEVILFVECHVNVGYGPFKIGKCVKLNFQDQYRNKQYPIQGLTLSKENLFKFYSKTFEYGCIECTSPDPHLHFGVSFLK